MFSIGKRTKPTQRKCLLNLIFSSVMLRKSSRNVRLREVRLRNHYSRKLHLPYREHGKFTDPKTVSFIFASKKEHKNVQQNQPQ